MASTSLRCPLNLPHLRRRSHLSRRHLPSAAVSCSSASTSSAVLTFDLLEGHLAAADYRKADHATRSLLIALAGDAAQKRGYVFFSEVQFIATGDLRAIDDLWRRHSGGQFGYSVQRRLWEKARRDFTRFFITVGWMRRMDTAEVEQFNYRSFPGEFIWELGDGTPAGHLPLTNALRGTQLLESILTHPAFEAAEKVTVPEEEAAATAEKGGKSRGQDLGSRRLSSDYSF